MLEPADGGRRETHMRSGPVFRDGTKTSRYDMNMTGYRELSVTPLSLRRPRQQAISSLLGMSACCERGDCSAVWQRGYHDQKPS